MDAVEKHLLSISQIPSNSGHSLHKGTPREAFIMEYLEGHLPSNVAIGKGEIIDAKSNPGQSRNQYDIVIYKRTYPKLNFGGNISGFLIEAVIAAIEVKSNLTQEEFRNAAKAARNSKQLELNFQSAHDNHLSKIKWGDLCMIGSIYSEEKCRSAEVLLKFVPLIKEDVEIMKTFPPAVPSLLFFRHSKGLSGVAGNEPVEEKYFYK